jgi:hypothetical protein
MSKCDAICNQEFQLLYQYLKENNIATQQLLCKKHPDTYASLNAVIIQNVYPIRQLRHASVHPAI